MAKSQTELSRYPSRHRPDTFVAAGQYLAELMCERKAKSEKKELPIRFWQEKGTKWYKYFCFQVVVSHRIIKKYGETHVIEAILDNKFIYSLTPKWVSEHIEQFEPKKKSKEKANIKLPENPNSTGQARKRNNNIITKLEDLDG